MSARHAPSRPDPLIEAPVLEFHRSSAIGAWSANIAVRHANGVYAVTETVTQRNGQLELPPGAGLDSEEGIAAFWAFFEHQVHDTVRSGVAPAALVEDLLRRLNDLPRRTAGAPRRRQVDGGDFEVEWLRDGRRQTLDLRPDTGVSDLDRTYLDLGDDLFDTLSACLEGPDPLDRDVETPPKA